MRSASRGFFSVSPPSPRKALIGTERTLKLHYFPLLKCRKQNKQERVLFFKKIKIGKLSGAQGLKDTLERARKVVPGFAG